MTLRPCLHVHACSGNYLVALAQVTSVIPNLPLHLISPRSVHSVFYLFCLKLALFGTFFWQFIF